MGSRAALRGDLVSRIKDMKHNLAIEARMLKALWEDAKQTEGEAYLGQARGGLLYAMRRLREAAERIQKGVES